MNTKHIVRVCQKIAGDDRVTNGDTFRLKDVDPGDTGDLRHEEEAIQATATMDAPCHVIPADNKWFTRIIVAAVIVETLDSLGLKFPSVSQAQMKVLQAARKQLLEEK